MHSFPSVIAVVFLAAGFLTACSSTDGGEATAAPTSTSSTTPAAPSDSANGGNPANPTPTTPVAPSDPANGGNPANPTPITPVAPSDSANGGNPANPAPTTPAAPSDPANGGNPANPAPTTPTGPCDPQVLAPGLAGQAGVAVGYCDGVWANLTVAGAPIGMTMHWDGARWVGILPDGDPAVNADPWCYDLAKLRAQGMPEQLVVALPAC
ncbi:MAG: hypothetical protein SPI77_07930 [Corynebacterium sp.]|nr:hypothetical protein [Corynebacterium sp.]